MPRVAWTQVDVRAVRMIHDWIAGMPGNGPASTATAAGVSLPPEDRAALEAESNSSIRARSSAIRTTGVLHAGALLLLGAIDLRTMSEPLRREIVAVTRSSPSVEVRDLFERFIPESERIKRLGDVVDRSSILTLRGDASRGRVIFDTNPGAQCKTCHKIGDVGQSVGPDLTKIGSKYDRAALLDQILEPSKTRSTRSTPPTSSRPKM